MRKTLVITDVTEMTGDEVCVAGIDEMGFCIRPVTPWGLRRHDLIRDGRAVVLPGWRVEFDLFDTVVEPPHVEDELFYADSSFARGRCTDGEWESVLRESCLHSVAEMFDGHLQRGRYVLPGLQTRSLGTIEGARIDYVKVDESYGRRRYRLSFQDASGGRYGPMPVNDLTFRTGMHRSVDALGDQVEAEQAVLEALHNTERTYLRIGLTRPRQLVDYPEACWTQVTGVYTFPDYLEGKTFADFL